MHIIRTTIWVLLLVALGIFSWANWDPRITVYIWEGMVVDTRLPAIVIISWLVGFVPLWLVHRASKWQFRRRISSLEAAMRNAVATSPDGAPTVAYPAAGAPASPSPLTPAADAGAAESKPLLP